MPLRAARLSGCGRKPTNHRRRAVPGTRKPPWWQQGVKANKMTATATPLTTPQLIMLRSLLSKGWPADLIRYIWERAGGAEPGWQALFDAGLTRMQGDRWELTPLGKRELKRQATGRWF